MVTAQLATTKTTTRRATAATAVRANRELLAAARKTVLVIQHVAHEGLGLFTPALAAHDVTIIGPNDPVPEDAFDVLIVLGGPMGAYEADRYPRLRDEMRAIERMLAADKPVLGICLGSQLLATVLGGRVHPSGTPEIGWFEVTRTGSDSLLDVLPQTFTALHWHNDIFDLPPGATTLARSAVTAHQAFAYKTRGAYCSIWKRMSRKRAPWRRPMG